ncbi:MAG: hypothetical protein SLAVMIC_00357 [uncultured marine phage]|uniref:Uncharacterized protein n=1 Tax=uncultured marine phage TaxID=707152 RepID=A0A8D9FR02_9VIRU|nr:MAG: hypothetical protein SLAVMIC_00357 [uncultured marine phage]
MLKIFEYMNNRDGEEDLFLIGNRRDDGFVDGCVIGKTNFNYAIGQYSSGWGFPDNVDRRRGFIEIDNSIKIMSKDNLFVGHHCNSVLIRYLDGLKYSFSLIKNGSVTKLSPKEIFNKTGQDENYTTLRLESGMMVFKRVNEVKFKPC